MTRLGRHQGGLLIVVIGPLWLASAIVLLTGCGPDCEDLQEICDRCHDPTHKQSCEASVDRDDTEECESNVDAFEDICR